MDHLFKCALGEYVSGELKYCHLCKRWISPEDLQRQIPCEGLVEPTCHHVR